MGEAGKGQDRLKVFISYSRKDSEKFADELVDGLEFHGGFAVTIDRHSIVEGEDWKKRLSALIADADTVVFIVSPGAAASPICQWEVDEAARMSKRILPVLWLPTGDMPVPERLAALHYTRFDEERSFMAGLRALVTSLNTDLDWLRDHTKYLSRALQWDEGARAGNRLMSGKDIADMKAWAARRPKNAPDLTTLHLDFLKASEEAETARFTEERRQLEEMRAAQAEREAALAKERKALEQAADAQKAREAEQKRRERLQKLLLTGAVAAAIGFGAFGLFSYNLSLKEADSRATAEMESNRAKESEGRAIAASGMAESRRVEVSKKAEELAKQTEIALARKRETEKLKEQAQRTESGLLATAASGEIDKGDAGTALLLALEALPDEPAGIVRPYMPEAERQLDRALRATRERTVLLGHTDAVKLAVFSPDGKRALTGSDDTTARVWNVETGEELTRFEGHDSNVSAASFNPDGKRVVTAAWDSVRIWDVETGKHVAQLEGHEGGVRTAVFSPDGRRVLTAAWDHTARLWDAESGTEIARFNHEGDVNSASFSPDGMRVVTSSNDETARIWDLQTGKEIVRLKGHGSLVKSANFSPDGTRVVSASWDKTARIWDAQTGKELVRLEGHQGFVHKALYGPDGKQVLTVSDDGTARLWDAETGKLLFRLEGHRGALAVTSFSPDSKHVLTAAEDNMVRIWHADSGKEFARLEGHQGSATAASFSPDGIRVLTGSKDRTARVWDVTIAKEVTRLEGHSRAVTTASFSPDGQRVVTGSWDDTARIWDPETGKEVLSLEGHTDMVTAAAFSPDGRRVVTGSWDDTARIWDAESGTEIARFNHEGDVNSASFSPDGKRVVTSSDDKTARIWDLQTGKEIVKLLGHAYSVKFASFSPDGLRVVTGSSDNTARIWDSATGTELARLEGHTGNVNAAAYSPDGKRVVTGSDDMTARVWDVETGKEIARLKGHESELKKASFSPDGKRALTASGHFLAQGKRDNTVRVWDIATGKEIARLEGHGALTADASYSRDGKLIVTVAGRSLDTPYSDKTADTARIWRVFDKTRDLVGSAKLRASRCLTPEQRNSYFLPAEPPAWCSERRLWPYDAASSVARANDGIAKDDYQLALQEAGLALERAAPGAPGQWVTGHAYLLRGQVHDLTADTTARDIAFSEALGRGRDVSAYFLGKAGDLEKKGKADEARTAYDDAVRWASREGVSSKAKSWALLARGKAHHAAGRRELAMADFESVDPKQRVDVASYFIETAKALVDQEKHVEGLAAYDEAVNWASRNGMKPEARSEAFLERGKAHHAAGRREFAMADFKAAGPVRQADVAGYFIESAKSLAKQEKHDEAMAAYDAAVGWAASDGIDTAVRSMTYAERGKAHHSAGRRELAMADFEAASPERQADIAGYLIEGAEAFRFKDKPDDALAAAEEAVNWTSRDGIDALVRARAFLARGIALWPKKQYEKVLADFREAERLGHEGGSGWVWRLIMSWANATHLEKPVDSLLLALPHALGLTPQARKAISISTMKQDAIRMSFPVGVLHARLALERLPAPSVTECDRLAAYPSDPLRIAPGVEHKQLDAAAVAACDAALAASPGEARLLSQRGRAHSKAGSEADKAKDLDRAKVHRSLELSDLRAALERGYPMAFYELAGNYKYGLGVEEDEAKAADLYLESFNRVAHCCAVPVARHLFEVEAQYDKDKIRQVAAALLGWSADLGNAEAHAYLAELMLDGRLAAAAAGSARLAAYEHLKVAEHLHTAAGKPDAAAAAAAKATTLTAEISDADRTTANTRAAAFSAAKFSDLPPWLRVPAESVAAGP